MPQTPTTDADAYLFTLTLRNILTDEMAWGLYRGEMLWQLHANNNSRDEL